LPNFNFVKTECIIWCRQKERFFSKFCELFSRLDVAKTLSSLSIIPDWFRLAFVSWIQRDLSFL